MKPGDEKSKTFYVEVRRNYFSDPQQRNLEYFVKPSPSGLSFSSIAKSARKIEFLFFRNFARIRIMKIMNKINFAFFSEKKHFSQFTNVSPDF